MGLNDKGVANNWVYSNGDTSRLVFLAHEKLNVKNYILVSQTGTWGSLSILSHIIVLMYRLTVVGSLEDVISSRTFSVCSKVCSKSSTFFIYHKSCIYFKFYANLQTNSESTDVCVEDKRCEATLT